MRQISNQYKTINAGRTPWHFWRSMAQKLWLLILALTRSKYLSGIFFHEPDDLFPKQTTSQTIAYPNKINNQNASIMKPVNRLMKWVTMLLIATVCATTVMAQAGPYPNTGDHSVCVNTTKEYGVPLNLGSSYVWTIIPATGYTMTPGATPNLISVNWTSPGTYTMTVIETNADGCISDPVSIVITVNPLPICSITGPNK
jgi:hypothetical protein